MVSAELTLMVLQFNSSSGGGGGGPPRDCVFRRRRCCCGDGVGGVACDDLDGNFGGHTESLVNRRCVTLGRRNRSRDNRSRKDGPIHKGTEESRKFSSKAPSSSLRRRS